MLQQASALYPQRQASGECAPIRLFKKFAYAAGLWHKRFRAVLKAEVMALGDNLRLVVTSLQLPKAQVIYADLNCARGQAKNFIK